MKKVSHALEKYWFILPKRKRCHQKALMSVMMHVSFIFIFLVSEGCTYSFCGVWYFTRVKKWKGYNSGARKDKCTKFTGYVSEVHRCKCTTLISIYSKCEGHKGVRSEKLKICIFQTAYTGGQFWLHHCPLDPQSNMIDWLIDCTIAKTGMLLAMS